MVTYTITACTDHDLLRGIQAMCDLGTQKSTAEFLGVSEQYVCDILKGRRAISAQVAAKLGFEPHPRLWVKPAG